MTHKCNIIFDYISPHDGEYWYHCTTCGAREWFDSSTVVPTAEPLQNCRSDDDKYCYDYKQSIDISTAIDALTRAQLVQIIQRYSELVGELVAVTKKFS